MSKIKSSKLQINRSQRTNDPQPFPPQKPNNRSHLVISGESRILLNLRSRSTGLRRIFRSSRLISASSTSTRINRGANSVSQPAADGAEEIKSTIQSTTSVLVTSRNLNRFCNSEKGGRDLFSESRFPLLLRCSGAPFIV